METNYLNEQKYQKVEKTISLIAVLALIIGLCLGGFLIYKGIAKPSTSKVDELKVKLEVKKSELEAKGVKYDKFAKYSDGEAYDLKIITDVLDPSFSHCIFSEYENNSLTKNYCAAKNSTGDFASSRSTMFGTFICIATCMISFSIFMFAKRRHVLAFTVQQTMPVAKEGINEMALTIGNVAKEISKGIKDRINDDKE